MSESWILDDVSLRAMTVGDAVAAADGWAPDHVPPPDRVRGISHLADTVMTALGHCSRHLDGVKGSVKDPASLAYNLQHLENHLGEAVDHHSRLVAALGDHYPEIGAELEKLHQVTHLGDAAASDAPMAAAPRSVPGDYDVTERRGGPEPA